MLPFLFMDYSFGKNQKLTGEKNFSLLMDEGNVFSHSPVRARWRVFQDNGIPTIRVAFSVPKKKFKKANKRNLLKRRMREAFRLKKGTLVEYLSEKGLLAHILFIYSANEIVNYNEIESKIIITLQRIKSFHEKSSKRISDTAG